MSLVSSQSIYGLVKFSSVISSHSAMLEINSEEPEIETESNA